MDLIAAEDIAAIMLFIDDEYVDVVVEESDDEEENAEIHALAMEIAVIGRMGEEKICPTCVGRQTSYTKALKSPVSLTHLTLASCFRLLHPISMEKLKNSWFVYFSQIALRSSCKHLLFKFGDEIATGGNYAHVLRLYKHHFIDERYPRVAAKIKDAEPLCCCVAKDQCKKTMMCLNFWTLMRHQNSFYKFMGHAGGDGRCCCDGYYTRRNCTKFQHVSQALLIHDLLGVNQENKK